MKNTVVSKSVDLYSRTRILNKEEVNVTVLPTESSKLIQVIDNNIYFTGDITEESMLYLTTVLRNVVYSLPPQANMQTQQIMINSINLFIYSYGGSATAAFSVYDEIRLLKKVIDINTIVSGIAASGGSILAISGTKRFMKKNSLMLIHDVSYGFYGKLTQHIEETENVKKIKDMMKKIYLEESNLKVKELDKLLNSDIYLTPDECVKYGLVDGIL